MNWFTILYPISPWILVLMLETPYSCLSSASFLSTFPLQDLPMNRALFLTPVYLPNSCSILKDSGTALHFLKDVFNVFALAISPCCGPLRHKLPFLSNNPHTYNVILIYMIICFFCYFSRSIRPLRKEATPILFNIVF